MEDRGGFSIFYFLFLIIFYLSFVIVICHFPFVGSGAFSMTNDK